MFLRPVFEQHEEQHRQGPDLKYEYEDQRHRKAGRLPGHQLFLPEVQAVLRRVSCLPAGDEKILEWRKS